MAKMPPWPSSSARRMNKEYLILTTRIKDQKISDNKPRTLAGAG